MNYKNLKYYNKIIELGFEETTGPRQKKEGIVKFTGAENEFVYWPITGTINKRYSFRNVAQMNINKGISDENYSLAFFMIYYVIRNQTKSSNKTITFDSKTINNDLESNIKEFFIKIAFNKG